MPSACPPLDLFNVCRTRLDHKTCCPQSLRLPCSPADPATSQARQALLYCPKFQRPAQNWAALVGLLTCQRAFVASLQHCGQSEEGKGHVEMKVLGALHSPVATVHLAILLCSGDPRVPQTPPRRAWKTRGAKGVSRHRAARPFLGEPGASWQSPAGAAGRGRRIQTGF